MNQNTNKTELQLALSQSRKTFLAVALFSFVINGLMLTTPLYMLQIYDRVLTSGNMDTLIALSVLAGGLLMSQGVLEWVRARILVRLSARLDSRLNTKLLRAIVLKNLGHTGVSASQSMRDFESLRGFLTGRGLIAFFDAPWIPLYLGLIFLLHPTLGMIATGGAVLLFLLTALSEFFTRKRLKEAAANAQLANNFADTSLRNAEAIEAMGMLPPLTEKWRKYHDRAVYDNARANDRTAVLTSIAKFIRPALQIAILGVGAWLAIQKVITPGVMIAASIIMGRGLAPVEALISQWRSIIQLRSMYRRLNELLQDLEDKKESIKLPRPSGDLSVENVIAVPPSMKKAVIQNVSFSLDSGEVLGIIGPSAAGKSSLARLLVGTWKPVAGQVRLDGADVAIWPAEDRGQYIGYVPQDVELFDGTVTENISRFTKPDSDAVLKAATIAGAHDMILRLADGYDTQIGVNGWSLSGGQRQRIALARALYGDPPLVVLDEPNANLDKDGENALRAAIIELKKSGQTVIFISHHSSVLNVCDKLLYLQRGRVSAFGPRQEVIETITRTVSDQEADGRSAGQSVSAIDGV